jgi:hypothetical protein
MRRLVLLLLLVMAGFVFEADEIMLASISSSQNLLGIDSSMGASGAAAAETFHLLLPSVTDKLLVPSGTDKIDVVH